MAAGVLQFTKMHGIGNDYVYVNLFEEKVADPRSLAIAVSDRHFGVGSDGLILIMPSKTSDVRMRMFNPDGSESEMCGNGVRCLAKYAYDHGICRSRRMRVETGAGEKSITLILRGGRVIGARVDMGVPDLHRAAIPMKGRPDELAINIPLRVLWKKLAATCVSMGNPHCIIFTRNVDAVPLETLAAVIETLPIFPKRVNVTFAQVLNRSEIKVRTWERGTGPTLACGTGTCASVVAAAVTRRTGRRVEAHVPGGILMIDWTSSGRVMMTGPAVEVFTGEWMR